MNYIHKKIFTFDNLHELNLISGYINHLIFKNIEIDFLDLLSLNLKFITFIDCEILESYIPEIYHMTLHNTYLAIDKIKSQRLTINKKIILTSDDDILLKFNLNIILEPDLYIEPIYYHTPLLIT